MMRVLVLGIEEFIGGRVAAALAASGWAEPLADPAGIAASGIAGVTPLAGTAAGEAAMAGALAGIDAVVNTVSSDPAAIGATATRLFTAARRLERAPLIVHVSSMSVYGPVTGDIDEDAPLTGTLGPYAQAKVDAERLAQAHARRIVLRPGCEYGPGGELWSGRVARWLMAHRLGDLGAAGDGACNLVHVDDLADAVLRALRRPEAIGQALNLAVPEPPTWNDYLLAFARALGAVPVRRISRRQLAVEAKLLAPPLKILEIALGRTPLGAAVPPPLPPSFLRLAAQDIRLDSRRARAVLDWPCRPIAQGLEQTAAWVRDPARR